MAWTFLVYLQAALGGTIWTSTRPSVPDQSSTPSPFPVPSSPTFPSILDTSGKLCLGLHDVFIALLLVLLILMTVFGNVLVVLSVFVYKRMRTFTNILLTSLATADLLVGLVVMPLSLLDLLHSHNWPFGRLLCSIWATTDVLLCTASILNLCLISIDRYMAITSPLKYPRTRSRKMAALLLSGVWILSVLICSPPWFVPAWNLFAHIDELKHSLNRTSGFDDQTFQCAYSTSPLYRIYSAVGSFYFPLLVMLFVYFKIFRVASEREALMRQSVGTCRLSNRIVKTQDKNNRHNPRCASAPMGRNRMQQSANNGSRTNYAIRGTANPRHMSTRMLDSRLDSSEAEETPPGHDSWDASQTAIVSNGLGSPRETAHMQRKRSLDKEDIEKDPTLDYSVESGMIALQKEIERTASPKMERECHSLADLADRSQGNSPRRKNTEVRTDNSVNKRSQPQTRLQPQNLMAKAHEHYQMCGPGKAVRGSKEKMVYLRERKALKTIGIVVLGFIVCWMPFFVLYLLEVFFPQLANNMMFRVLNEFFLWLGYSNSSLNPIIYTMYNGDFRRCFRDLLSFGCIQHHRRTMSVKKLHQQSTIF